MRRITQFVHVIRLFCMVEGIFALLLYQTDRLTPFERLI